MLFFLLLIFDDLNISQSNDKTNKAQESSVVCISYSTVFMSILFLASLLFAVKVAHLFNFRGKVSPLLLCSEKAFCWTQGQESDWRQLNRVERLFIAQFWKNGLELDSGRWRAGRAAELRSEPDWSLDTEQAG